MNQLFASNALTPSGWAKDVLLTWNDAGTLTSVITNATPNNVARSAGPLLPGMPNLHSHAFQRAMAGLTEYVVDMQDNFWSWRNLMYSFAQKLTPEDLQVIARQVYIEMLKAGYTSVCEFHYLHHDRNGVPYADRMELSRRIMEAASSINIGLTLLPVLYRYSGLGNKPPLPGQSRFLNDIEGFVALVEDLLSESSANPMFQIGVAPHSLRAVSKQDLSLLLDEIAVIAPRAPIHIHIAEQTKEVDDFVDYYGCRPVEWLLNEFPVDERWCHVHATHLEASEVDKLAASKSVVGICATTEANLGDGIFPGTHYLSAGGRFGIGSDSHVTISVAEELRMFEYSQRLLERQRNRLATPSAPAVADGLYLGAVKGGAQASGRALSGLAVGQRADFVILDDNHPDISPRPAFHQLAGWIFCNHGAQPVRDVFVGGHQVITEGHHKDEESAAADYRNTLTRLLSDTY